MALNGMGLGFLFTATDVASGVMDGIKKNFQGLEEASGQSIAGLDKMVGGLGTSLAGLAIGVGGLSAAFALSDKAAKFETSMAAVGAVTHASAAEMKLLEAASKKAVDLGASPIEAMQGLNDIAQAGYDTKESIELLNPVLMLAAGSLGDLSPSEAAGLATQGLKAFGIETKDAGLMVDQLLQSANAFAVKPKDLALGLGTAASGAQTLNQSLTDTVIAFGLIKNVVPGTERSATALKVMMEQLAKPKIAAALKAQGIAVSDSSGNFRRMFDILKDLQPKLDQMTEKNRSAFLMKIFGSEGLTGANAIFAQLNSGIKGFDGVTRTGAEAVDELQKSFRGANGVAKDFSDRMLEPLEGRMKKLKASSELLAIELGTPFKDVFKPIVSAALDAVNGLIAGLQALPQGFKTFMAWITVIGLALLVVVSLGALTVLAWPLIVAAWGAFTLAVEAAAVAIGAALLAIWPFIAAGLALWGLFKLIGYAVSKNLQGIGTQWDKLSEAFHKVIDGASGAWERFTNYAGALWDEFSKGFIEQLEPLWDVFSVLFEMMTKALGAFGGKMDDVTSGPGDAMKAFFYGLGVVIGFVVKALGMLVGVFLFVIPIITWVIKALAHLIGLIADGISSLFGLETKTTSGTRGLFTPEEQKQKVAETTHKKAKDEGKAVSSEFDPAAQMSSLEGIDTASLSKQDRRLVPKLTPNEQIPIMDAKNMHASGEPIDFDKMGEAVAKANAKRPFNVNLNVDGQKLYSWLDTAHREDLARSSGKDMDER